MFLTYNPILDKPNRFGVKSIDEKNFATSSLVNLNHYEKSIRKRETDTADVENVVYLSSSQGFYPISPWLSETQINGLMVTEYNGQSDIRMGPGLEGGMAFTCDIELEGEITPSTTKSIEITFGVNPESDPSNWSGLIGTQVTITGTVSNLDKDIPTVTLASGTCYSMQEIPDTRIGKDVVDIIEYTVY